MTALPKDSGETQTRLSCNALEICLNRTQVSENLKFHSGMLRKVLRTILDLMRRISMKITKSYTLRHLLERIPVRPGRVFLAMLWKSVLMSYRSLNI